MIFLFKENGFFYLKLRKKFTPMFFREKNPINVFRLATPLTKKNNKRKNFLVLIFHLFGIFNWKSTAMVPVSI